MRNAIHSSHAPAAIGSYSPAIKMGDALYLSGQIPIDPATGELVVGDMTKQVTQVFKNLQAVAEAAGSSLDQVAKLNVFLLDLTQISVVNEVIKQFFREPFPARTSIEVKGLPKNVPVEIDAIIVTG